MFSIIGSHPSRYGVLQALSGLISDLESFVLFYSEYALYSFVGKRSVGDKQLQTFVNGDAPCASAITLSRVLVYHSVNSTASSSFKYSRRMIKTRSLYLCAKPVLFVCFYRHIAIMEVSCIDSTVAEESAAQ